MASPFLGEIRIMAFNFPPNGWALCDGQTLAIAQNQALFALIGTIYGGNGVQTFGLPDLRGRIPIHMGSQFIIGQVGGQEAHTLTINEMPQHLHPLTATTAAADSVDPSGRLLAQPVAAIYAQPGTFAQLRPGLIGNTGGSQPHANLMPLLVLSFCIALQGIFPARN